MPSAQQPASKRDADAESARGRANEHCYLQPAVVHRASRISPPSARQADRQPALDGAGIAHSTNISANLTSDIMERSSQRVIHAYAHVRTNQVLYSFTPTLHVSISTISHLSLYPADNPPERNCSKAIPRHRRKHIFHPPAKGSLATSLDPVNPRRQARRCPGPPCLQEAEGMAKATRDIMGTARSAGLEPFQEGDRKDAGPA